MVSARESIVAALLAGVSTVPELVAAAGRTKNAVNSFLYELRDAGLVTCSGKRGSTYQWTVRDREALGQWTAKRPGSGRRPSEKPVSLAARVPDLAAVVHAWGKAA